MSLKLLIAACCLLAAVQARPQKPPTTSTCSLACVSRTFWSGYQVGKVYTYEFEQTVELTSELSRAQASRLRLSGLAKVEVHSDCELALSVEVKDSRVGDIDDADTLSPREPPAKVAEALRLPLRFAFENGQVAQLCPSAGETRASLNFKRGLLSQLQVSTEQRGQAHQLEERDVLGDCWTEYTPEGPNTLLKTKDLSKCKLNYQAYPLTGVKSFDDETLQAKRPITKGNLKCRIEIDAVRDIVKETVCDEEQTQSHQANTEDSVEETVRTKARLTLKSEASGLVNALEEVTKRTDLRHAHKTNEQCHSASAWLEEDLFHTGNECVERTHGAKTSAEYKAQAKRTLEELCEDTKATKGMTREAPRKYADLIKYLRGITDQEHFNDIYKLVSDGLCKEDSRLLRTIMRSAIPTVGTKQSVALILDQLNKAELEGAHRDNWLINGIALMQHPTADILPELLNYVRKRRNDAMLGVTRDEPLALSAVVHKICQEMPNCETEPRVKAVIDYFSESLGPDCEQFSTDADNAFVALLSVGNMGRVAGGAKALTRCAASASLPTVYRVFALHSLRRFGNLSTEAQNQLADLLIDPAQDAELRIAAYQAMARYGFERTSRLYEAARSLLDATEDDRQVQMYIHTHLKSLRGEAARQAAPLLKAAKLAGELNKLSRREYSSVQRADYFSEALSAGAQAEVPIVFSAQSAIPRYVGLNLTVNWPGQGQSVNLMEIGMRMQGLEQLMEEIYSRIAKKFNKAESSGSQVAPAASEQSQSEELSTEQRDSFGQAATEPRIDLLVRRYGVEVSHSDISGGFLKSLPDIASKSDYKSLYKMLAPGEGSDPIGVSAGTLSVDTLAIPTITGLPILVKKETHYLTNLRVDTRVSTSLTSVKLQPAAAVVTTRTVAIDAIFERAGIQTSTSVLTSTGLQLSLKRNDAGSADRQFSFKVEPLVKKQQLADAKTEVNFFQHTAGKVHVEKPLAPQESSVKREKCSEGIYKKYIGHKICYKTDYLPSCRKSLRDFCQCPGSYQLYVEKDDDFGAFEVGFDLKNRLNIKQLQILVGDQKSKNRLLKFNAQYVIQGDKTNWKLELQNPIFPIVLDSNFTKDSDSAYQVYTELKAGSVDYVASGSVQPHSEKGIWVNGEVYPKEKPAQKLKVSLEHKYNGLSILLLPLAATKLQVKMHTGNQLSLEYNLKHETSIFAWQVNSQYKTSKGDVTSMRYRIQYTNKLEESTESSTFLYDLEVQNPKGNNLAHSLHTKVIQRTEGDIKQTTASVNHKLQYGAEKKRSPIDCEARISLKQTTESKQYKFTGDGELTHYWSGESFTAKLENLRIELGEVDDQIDGFTKQYRYAINYGIKVEEATADYQVELRHLQWKLWSLTKQAVELKSKATMGQKSYTAHLKHMINGQKTQAWQIAKFEYNNYVQFHLEHKMLKPEGTEAVRSEFYLQSTDGNKVQAKWGVSWPEDGTMTCDIVVDANGKKLIGSKHTVRYTSTAQDHGVKYEMTLEMPPSSYSLETNARIARQSAKDLANFLNYQVRLITGRYELGNSLGLLATLLQDLSWEQTSKLVGPTPSQRLVLENLYDMKKWSSGVFLKNLLQVTIDSRDIVKYGVTVAKTLQFVDSPISSVNDGLKIEVNAMDKSLKSEVDLKRYRESYKMSLKIASKDTWGWHDVKIDVSNQKPTSNGWETVAKLDGKIGKKSITSNMNFKYGWNDAKSQHSLNATFATPESKLRMEFSGAQSPVKLTAKVNLDGDFGLLPVKDFKASTDFSTEPNFLFESKAEIEGTQVVYAKLHLLESSFLVDLKTAHPKLQEFGIKIVQQKADLPEAYKCSTIIKFIGLGRRLQIKNTGTTTLSLNSPVYTLVFGHTGDMEFEGFDDLISYKKLEYELLLRKKPGMEFQFVTSISSPDHTSTKEPMLYLSSGLSYWPVKAEVKARVNNYKGWDVKYGARVEIDYRSAFAGIEYRDQEVSVTYDIQDQSGNVKKANIRVKCSFCTDNGRDLVAANANMTWPLRLAEFELGLESQINSLMLQKVAFRFVHRPDKKQILAAFLWDGRTQKLIDCSYSQTIVEGGIGGEAVLHSDLRFFLGDKARAKVEASYQLGKNKELKFKMTLAKDEEAVVNGKLFWLSAPRSYETIPVPNVDWGFQLKGMNADIYAVHIPKTGNSCQWRFSADLPVLRKPITARLDVADYKVTSGKITAFDHEILLSSSVENGVQVTVKTASDEAKTLRVKWSGKYEGLQDMRARLEIETDGKTNVIELKSQPRKIVLNYGRSTAPNSLQIDYELSDVTSLWTMTADVKISHETDADKNSQVTLIPGYTIPILTTRYPFKLDICIEATPRTLTIRFESVSGGVKEMFYKHNFPDFPWFFNIQTYMVSAKTNKKVWDATVQVASDVQVTCQIGSKFALSYKDAKLNLKLENVIDLKVQLPKILTSDDSEKKELDIQLTLPVLKIEEPIKLKATLQGLTEGQQLKVKYSRGEDDQEVIEWVLNARKFRVTPKFEVDLETSLTSKNAILGNWQIRSVEAKLDANMESLSDGDSYTIWCKQALKVNGDDLIKKVLRLDGKKNALPNKGELTMSGQVQGMLKFDLGKQDTPTKIRFTLEKLGESRNKYSMKLDISPVKSDALVPDFKLETECPHRQFVLGKEDKQVADERSVTLQLYLNKRQDHGVTIVYKKESPTSGTPKYTVEVELPTRKIRAVCQPEITDRKFGVMTTFDWDADKSTERILGLDVRVDFSTDIAAIVECKAPFLTNRIRIEGRHESKEDGWTVQLKHLSGDTEALKIKADYSYQRQAKNDVLRFTLETSGLVESKLSLSTQARDEIENFRRSKVDGTLKIKVSTMEKSIKFLYRPMREITVTCDHGASLSLKYTSDKLNLYQVVIFVSDNEKSAARLKLVCSKPAGKITAKLDIGSGSFKHDSDLRGPNYRPEQVLLLAEARRDGWDVSANAFLGRMTVGQKLRPFEATEVPAHLTFFAMAIQKAEYNKMKFSVNWRTPSKDKVNFAIKSLKRAFLNYLPEPSLATRVVLDRLRRTSFTLSSLNTAWITEEISSLASNDFDKLTRYCERALNENEFYLRNIISGARVAGRFAQRCLVAIQEAATTLKEALADLQIGEKIVEITKPVREAIRDFFNWIPYQQVWEAIGQYAEQVVNFGVYCYEKAVQNLTAYYYWVYAVVTDPTGPRAISTLVQKTGEYLKNLSPAFKTARDAASQAWSRARSIVGASVVGMKTLATDDLLPLVVNHLEDFRVVKEFYDNLLLELRIWYDIGATPEERTALTRSSKLLSYIVSEDSLERMEGVKLIWNGEFADGFKKLCSQYNFTVWRPNCDSTCQRGETFAAVQGYFYPPSFTLSLPMVKAPVIVLKRIGSEILRNGLPQASLVSAIMDSTVGNPIERLLAVRHRTAVISGDNHLITFDGLALNTDRACSYLVAREFPRGLFSIVQEYRKLEGRQVRDRLRVRFGNTRVFVERDGSVQVDGKAARLPLKRAIEAGKQIEATSAGDVLTVRFHASLRNTLVLRCSANADSCVISVHPLFHGSVYGLAGSNDGRRGNDIRRRDAKEHVRFWTAGQCVATGSASISDTPADSTTTTTNDCFAWFRDSSSPVARCFDTVDPRPYLNLCQQQERLSRDTCKAVRQYTDRCSQENVKTTTPAKCIVCRLDSDGKVTKPGLVTDMASLQKSLQVVFLVENSACAQSAVGTSGSRLRSLATAIDRLKSSNQNLKSVQFGLAQFGGSDSTAAALTSLPMESSSEDEDDLLTTSRRFGSLTELTAALQRLQTSTAASDEASVDVLRAIAKLPEQYQWEPLAQKHLVVVTCKPCNAMSWTYGSLFKKAKKSVNDQVFVHAISKNVISAEGTSPNTVGYDADFYHKDDWSSERRSAGIQRRATTSECAAELAVESGSTAKGSVWRLENLAAGGDPATQLQQLLVAKEFQRRLEKPGCRRCGCSGEGGKSGVQQPWCRLVACETD